ncbi:MAG: mannosyltransferase [Bacteroidetes bacterium]|nr:MAG: mannosyltransferase [Bacteroidota bacterium]
MRIGFDAKRAYNNISGLGNYSRYVISCISRFYPENDILLYTPRIADPDLFVEPAGSQVILPSGLLSRMFRSQWRSFKLPELLKAVGVNIFHGLSNELPFGIHQSGVPSLVTIHDLIFLERPELYKPVDRRIYSKKVAYACKHATRIIAVSDQTKRDIMRHLGVEEERIRVVYQGCHRQFYNRASEESRMAVRDRFSLPSDYLLYVGTIEERKNLLMIVRALHEGKIDIPLVVVGRKTPYFQQVDAYIRKNQIRNIHFLDHVHVSDLPAIYQESRGFIYPSSYEGFGIPVLEALNSRVPVITSAGGCLEETAGKGGLFIDPLNTEEMAHAIRRILEDKELRNHMIMEGGSHAMKFREEQTIPSLYQVYLECLHDA